MIEQLPSPSRVSLFEAVLARWLLELSGRQYFLTELPLPHARGSSQVDASEAERSAAGSPGTESPAPESPDPVDDCPELAGFRGLLEAGAGHLADAKAAEGELRRAAAVQARALASFAAQRPAAVLDRPGEQVGAAAAASRAARPGALTAVSEWAVDEVMVALGLSSRAASERLADSVTLAERLPATLDALEAGVIGWAHPARWPRSWAR